MSKITIIEPNSNDKDQTRNFMVKGERGYSAYDLYVQNGGTLTEEEWLDAFLNATNYYTKTEVDTSLGAKVNTSDIKDNLTSTDTNKPLSANQGKVLKGLIDTNTTAIGTKANASDVTEKTTYSTTEKAVGTWINGETIYRKVINVSDLTPTIEDSLSIVHGISNLDKVVSIKCIADTGQPSFFDFNNYTWQTDDEWSTIHIFVNEISIYINYQGPYYINWVDDVYFILEYTKTSS